MNMVLVSVITPVFNAEHYIAEAIKSVSLSDFTDYEHIVVDDGSTDASESVILQTLLDLGEEASSRVRFYSKENSGEADTDNFAMARAFGELVIVLNADDVIGSALLRRSAEVMSKNPDVVVTYPDWTMINALGEPIELVETKEFSFERLIGRFDCLPGPGACIRKSALGGDVFRNPQFPLISDYECWQRLSLEGSFMRIPEFHGYWRMHGENLSLTSRGYGWALQAIGVAKSFSERRAVLRDKGLKRVALLGLSRAYLLASIQGIWDKRVPMLRYLGNSLQLGFFNGRIINRKDVLILLKIVQYLFIRTVSRSPRDKS